MPRPVAFRKTMREAIINALLAGNTYRDACEAAGIPWSTWRDWSRQHREGGHPDPDVDALIAEARVAYAKASNAMTAQVRLAGAKDWRAAAWLLEKRTGAALRTSEARRARWDAVAAKAKARIATREADRADGVGGNRSTLEVPSFMSAPRIDPDAVPE